jgi:hypothetical protein
LSKVRCGANRTKPRKRNGIKGCSKRESALGAARFSGAAKEQARGRDVAVRE